MNKTKDASLTPNNYKNTSECIILIEIKEKEPMFFILKLSENPMIINLPENLKLNYDGFTKSASDFLNYGGGEYLADAINSVCELDGYFCIKGENLYNLIDVLDGATVNLEYDAENFKSGNQTLYGEDFKRLIDYSNTLSFDGKINFRVKIAKSVIDNYLFNNYTFSADYLYETVAKYSTTNIDKLKAMKITKAVEQLRENNAKIKVAYLQGDYIENNRYFVLSNRGKVMLQKSYYDD
jgi:anionic cell wall polymer biosynthesis LytR-Cps2A-Psr (LCP) family protein